MIVPRPGIAVILAARLGKTRRAPAAERVLFTLDANPELDPWCGFMESAEANIAGRMGLCVAAWDYLGARPSRVWRRLAEVGGLTRDTLAGLPVWQVTIRQMRPARSPRYARPPARTCPPHGHGCSPSTTSSPPPASPNARHAG